jgi:hypothetical protein
MVEFGHDELQMSHQRTCWKGYDGANGPRWNLEVESLVVRWVIQMEEDTHGLGVVENHMSCSGVVGKKMCCWFVLRLQEGRGVDKP